MYIKNIVLDGFKSYAQRTEVNSFDPLFNAITGLNGSGKSNILDSICFLLGITNLSHVRATNLQELIYKSGQAGVTKATVTISFDNCDKKQSPMGYETFDEITISRQIVLGGRNKYLINGCNANNTRVQDLFRSVQLNVNNPHFLIMQGRITKVLNMKPPEILSMIEEAAGTRMYESKKLQALKTMEKKQSKLNDIENVLMEEITPTIQKLKEERTSYLQYQKVMREIEHLTRLYVAHEFVKAEKLQHKSGSELEEMTATVQTLKQRNQEIDRLTKAIEAEVIALYKKKDLESGNVLKELERKLDEVSKIEVKASSAVKHEKEGLAAEKKKKKQLEKNLNDNTAQIAAKEKNLEKNNLSKLEECSKADSDGVIEAQNHYHAVSAGLSSNKDGEDKTLADQLMDCKNAVSKADTEMKQAQIKLKHEESELTRKQADLKSTAKGYDKDKASMDNLDREKTKIQAELNKLNYEEGREEQLVASKRQLQMEIARLTNIVENLEARFPNLQFEYSNPAANFDKNRVKGLVCNLISMNDVKHATCLQVSAGSKLFNVVVDNEKTGKQLLENGRLKRKVTFIPLNKIAARSINSDVVNRAKTLVGKENVHTALSLVGYDEELEEAMKFVFGSSFVAADLDIAKKVAFDPSIKIRTVTLEGDTMDPGGTLSGGSRGNQQPILATLQTLHNSTSELKSFQQQYRQVETDMSSVKKIAEKYNQLSTQLDMKTREVELIEERLKQSTHHVKVEELKAHENCIAEQKQIIDSSKDVKKNATDKTKDLEMKMNEKAAYREKELKNAESALTKAKQKSEASLKEFKTKQQELEEITLEIEELKTEITSLQEQMIAIDVAMVTIEEEITRLSQIADDKKAAVKEAEESLTKQKETLKECSAQISDKNKEKSQLNKEVCGNLLQLKELEHKISKMNKDSHDAARRVELMLEKYEWIQNERQYFGQANTAYDFTVNDPKEAAKKLNSLTDTKDKLSKNLNMRAMNMLGKAEEKYNDLMKKKKTVETDKEKIEDVIKELDEKKNEALRTAWVQVNRDFGSIFSTLLPGTNAKLSPPEGLSVLDGLEVKVAFGNVWKESLTELSGGQRSLVALSLILSLLLFKPAPIYILDEVDAALDLSHTQNIGMMLRQHFRHSQFIVVSLKDGMFNNANVLFKTKFVDGVSTVSRFVQNTSQRDTLTKNPLSIEDRTGTTGKKRKNR